MKKIFLGMLLTGITLLGACAAPSENQTSDKLQVVTTFYPMYEFTKQVVGSEGDVSVLLPAGTDSHDYEPSAKEIANIQNADVFVYNNENMEMWVPSIASTLETGNVNVVKATKDMLLLPGSEDEHDHEEHGHEDHVHELDPHVWLSPARAIQQVKSIRDQLIQDYPAKKEVFTTNAEKYLKELSALDQSYQETFSQAKQTNFVTQHAAFGYLALDYGLTQVPIAGLSPNEEPSPARLAELKTFVEDHGVKYIYFEANAKDSIARTLASEANVELEVLNPLESLTQEQLDDGETYISIMEQNRSALEKTTTVANDKAEKTIPAKEKTVYNGYFEDKDVQDRPLSDWSGDWQSVYPLLQNGTLDQVFDYKAKLNPEKSFQEYKEYYTTGYQTDVKNIAITADSMTFTFDDDTTQTANYRYVGKELLTYEAGNRGVRFLFEATDSDAAFNYVQFSDHSIAPTKSEHFHIYFGNESQEALSAEMDHWPTYYPTDLSGNEIAQEMLAH
ncbi:zinc ABC transporter substrate-binding protein AdcA [Enterococcus saccharolyticus]|uniref:zinc ABC transporter substrate-binding protein AdcA n=1 Tax=Enterococcus saccharolyticus TaxID=41997 RepID=UPI001E30394D|nr:zinc ABC transporter substrate-binding protein AdcA [Enterococcus saccharolyticus]MCD5002653.1 zinc ABC transporter substrate-binding protein AdcA [Enterococcus saccharolyticus]